MLMQCSALDGLVSDVPLMETVDGAGENCTHVRCRHRTVYRHSPLTIIFHTRIKKDQKRNHSRGSPMARTPLWFIGR